MSRRHHYRSILLRPLAPQSSPQTLSQRAKGLVPTTPRVDNILAGDQNK